MEVLAINLSSKVRRATLHGRDYLVAPLTLIVPGVLNGSKGPLYYPPEEIGRDPGAWNGIPIVVYHPQDAGTHVSARDPVILDKQEVGRVFKANVRNDRLVAEGWFDLEKTRQVSSRVLKNLEAGKPIELSTGLFTDNEPAAENANYNGKGYAFIARNYRPDHLAILPDQKGACSLQDGCGVLANTSAKVKRLLKRALDEVLANVGINQGYHTGHEGHAGHEASEGGTGGMSLGDLRGMVRGSVNDSRKALKAALKKKSYKEKLEVAAWYESKSKSASYEEGGGGNYLKRQYAELAKAARESTWNAGINQPHSKNTGKFKPLGAGTGRGKVHEYAQKGNMVLTDRHKELGADAKVQAGEGDNPPSWAVDEDKWDKAKQIVEEKMADCDEPYACITYIYEHIGGIIGNQSSTEGGQDMALNPEKKREIIDALIVNCGDCGWKEKDREALNSMADETLLTLEVQRGKLLANAAVVQRVREKLRIPETMTVNAMPDFIKEKMSDCVDGKDKDGKPCGEAAEEPVAATEKKEDKPLTNEQIMAALSPEMREDLAFARAEKSKQKQELVSKLTTNIEDQDLKARHAKRLQSRSLDELRADVALLPPPKELSTNYPLYIGAAAPVGNVGGQLEDVLELPVMNFERLHKTSTIS